MFQLYDHGNNVWEICSEKQGSFKSGFELVIRKAINWGIPFRELEMAVESMLRNDDDYADFGIYKTFLFSTKTRKAS